MWIYTQQSKKNENCSFKTKRRFIRLIKPLQALIHKSQESGFTCYD